MATRLKNAASERDLSGLAAQLRLVITRTARRLRQEAASDLGPSQAAALATIERHGPLKPSELAPLNACVVAEFEGCRTAPVPTLADPCDVNRTHDDYSRVIEQARITARLGPCPQRPTGRYHRVRVLLGLDNVGDPDEPGKQALKARS